MMSTLRTLLIAVMVWLLPGLAGANQVFTPWEATFFSYLEGRYGMDARERFARLEAILRDDADKSTIRRLRVVNQFFNELPWVADEVKWRQTDYWATIDETVGTFGGDCEDMVLAKFTALLALGVDPNSLAITYVKLQRGGAHMVLTYFSSRGVVPLVLDSLSPRILPMNRRQDLLPVYSFNRRDLWTTNNSGKVIAKMPSTRLKKWVRWKKHYVEMQKEALRHNAGRPIFPALAEQS